MLMGITGLHGAGKSFFSNNIPNKYGYTVVNKKELIENICLEETGRKDWAMWYKESFLKNPVNMTLKILNKLPDANIILDAIHSNLEWEIIKEYYPNSILLAVITMEDDRVDREEVGDKEKNIKRIEYWHNPLGNKQCLLTEISWCFNGSDTLDNMEKSFVSLLNIIKRKNLDKEKVKILKKECMENGNTKSRDSIN